MNLKMGDLQRCFEKAGFTGVKTLLSSGNVIFETALRSNAAVERKAEEAMRKHLGKVFYTIARSGAALRKLVKADAFKAYRLPSEAKRVVTFLRKPPRSPVALPAEVDGARVLGTSGPHVFSAYVPGPRGPVFMTLIEKTYGKDVTTRTWETVVKCAKACSDE
jgi:uncharacterized protein (DUF1697 family)